MMKKVNLSHLLSRSPRHGGGRRGSQQGQTATTNTEVFEVLVGCAPSTTSEKPPSSKKKSKTGILQTLKKKISGKLDACQSSHCSSPKKSKSFEGLSNSFGDSFSQSISEESSSDGLNTSAGQCHKGKHNKRAIRPMHTPVTRQNSSTRVVSEGVGGECLVGGRVPLDLDSADAVRLHTDRVNELSIKLQNSSARVLSDGEDGIRSSVDCADKARLHPDRTDVLPGVKDPGSDKDKTLDQPFTVLPLNGKAGNHISETTTEVPALTETNDGCDNTTLDHSDALPKVVVDAVNGNLSAKASECDKQEHGAISETSSPVSYGELLGPQNTNLDASKRSLAEELFRLARFGWYWGPITRSEAEEKLVDQPDGAFLVRDSSDDKYLLSLSFRSYNKTLHTRIEHSNGWFSFYPHPEHEGHTSLVGLIYHCMSHSESGVFCFSRARVPGSPSFPVRLTKPVSRFTQVRSLQYLCRFVIRQFTRVDHIQALPLPTRIKGYLEEGHY